MGIKESEAITLARKIGFYNCEAIHYVKNSLMLLTPEISKNIKETREKLFIIIRTNFPKANPDLILANNDNNENHDITKLDVDLITEILLENPEETNELSD